MDVVSSYRSTSKTSKSKRGGARKKYSYETSKRLKGVRVVKPFVYGNLSWKLLPEQQRDCHTHQWIVYIRGYNDEDISAFVKQVQFKLHVSYDNPVRVCHNPPYQVTETGWGEFEIMIRVYFKDIVEKPVTLYHYLRLIPKEGENPKKPIVAELYDEFIFIDPTLIMYQMLNLEESTVPGPTKNWIDHEEKKAADLEKILTAKEKLRKQIEALQTKLVDTKAIIGVLKSPTAP